MTMFPIWNLLSCDNCLQLRNEYIYWKLKMTTRRKLNEVEAVDDKQEMPPTKNEDT